MGLPSRRPVPARHRHAPPRADDHAEAPPPRHGRRRGPGLLAGLILVAPLAVPTFPAAFPAAAADTLRIAAYDSGLGRKGPGVMLRDLRAAKDKQSEAAIDVIAAARADVVLLLDVDWDNGGAGLAALADRLAEHGLDYPHRLALRPVSGTPSGVDLDGDGTAHGPRDALGYGWFTGDSGLALLSRLPLGSPRDLSGTLWSDRSDAADVLPQEARALVPLATTAQWVVPLTVGRTRITLVTMDAGTPVFDGPEDRNGLRNRDELAFVAELAAGTDLPVVLGRANIDPERGEGYRDALRALLDLPVLQDPAPQGARGRATVAWETVGPMRVDYVLPPRALEVLDAGIVWPGPGDPLLEAVEAAGTGRLVWVDVSVP